MFIANCAVGIISPNIVEADIKLYLFYKLQKVVNPRNKRVGRRNFAKFLIKCNQM